MQQDKSPHNEPPHGLALLALVAMDSLLFAILFFICWGILGDNHEILAVIISGVISGAVLYGVLSRVRKH